MGLAGLKHFEIHRPAAKASRLDEQLVVLAHGQQLAAHDIADVDGVEGNTLGQDLEDAIKERRFREDLYYRLKVFAIHLPPLRERMQDLPMLVEHFVKLFNRDLDKEIRSVPPETLRMLESYDWPGNVRELRNTVERAASLAHHYGRAGDVVTITGSGLGRDPDEVRVRIGGAPVEVASLGGTEGGRQRIEVELNEGTVSEDRVNVADSENLFSDL